MTSFNVYPVNSAPSATTEPDWDGFRLWRATNPLFKELRDSEPSLIDALTNSLDHNDYVSASVVWNELKEKGAVSPQLMQALGQAINDFNLPDELRSKL